MATTPRKIIDKGVLKTFFLDTYYASKLGAPPTTGGMSNLVWSTGKRDAAAMLADMSEGIFVTSFLGGNSNSTTGDFSVGIKGFYVKNGKIVATGAGAAVLGGPVQSVAWLANKLGQYDIGLKKGEIILSGSAVAAVPVLKGDSINLTVDRIGTVSFFFS